MVPRAAELCGALADERAPGEADQDRGVNRSPRQVRDVPIGRSGAIILLLAADENDFAQSACVDDSAPFTPRKDNGPRGGRRSPPGCGPSRSIYIRPKR